jgi:predicted nuclease of predicted toxin-antitoxin system
MKLLLDQGLPRSAADLLRKAGIDTVHTGEIGYAAADDGDILEYARVEGRVVATLDADFHTLLALSGAVSPSVIRIRIEGLRGEAATTLLQRVLQQCDEDLQQGSVVTVQEGRLRIRRLPLVR